MELILLVVSGGFAVARIAGSRGDLFKDFAHVWVGMLIGAWMLGLVARNHLRSIIEAIRGTTLSPPTWHWRLGAVWELGRFAGWLALVLSVIEVAAAIWFRFHV